MGKILLDKNGYEEFLNQIEKIKKRIDENAKSIALFASDDAYGDGWHDNFAYEEATKKEISLYKELDKKMKELKDIEIIEESDDKDCVSINSVVTLLFDGLDEEEKYILTGNASSNINDEISSITANSPLGRALINKKVNDTFSYKVEVEDICGKLISIEKINNI